ncbi:hypothetical protein PN498_22465 [Oscillatoria sp. CS-180]|uniref:hypothetical protein n=1 Tax=Oscillatoria sp. CS-180 TaxID=3021720 RepID=UPI00232FAA9C|nr:hypothetical protein [Oscillatoria sp. CS-180]MDB9528773.1 hypothetical protein [Oscillatoria sp. CS-180]
MVFSKKGDRERQRAGQKQCGKIVSATATVQKWRVPFDTPKILRVGTRRLIRLAVNKLEKPFRIGVNEPFDCYSQHQVDNATLPVDIRHKT